MSLRCSAYCLSVAAAGVLGVVLAAEGQAQNPAGKSVVAPGAKSEEDVNKWMQSKLHSSQEIFAALTRGDTKAIETNARRMLVINVMEQWKSGRKFKDHSEYDAQLNAFEFAAKELARTGRNGDIDGALEAYVLLSKSCVKCHQAIRDGAADPKK